MATRIIDVFVRDLVGGSNTLVSTSLASDGADGPSADPAISSDGRYVAFDSSADNLVTGDTNQASDVFVRDLQTGTTVLVSVGADGTGPGNRDSLLSGFSASGRYILFRSFSTNLVSGVGFKGINLFWRDLQIGKTYAVTSAGTGGAVYGNPLTSTAGSVMTPDGRYVFFIAPWLSLPLTAAFYVWDALPGAIVYTNVASSSSLSSFFSELHVSPDSHWVLYSDNGLYALDWRANTNVLISPAFRGFSSRPQFSADSRFLVYSAPASSDSVMTNQVYLWDFQSKSNLLVSRSYAVEGGANGNSGQPTISADGRYLAYSSTATDLVPGATNGVRQLYLFDVVNGATTLVSASGFGPFGTADNSALPILSADGGLLVFESTAADLAEFDFNSANDLFTFSVPSTNVLTPFEVTVAPGSVNPAISWPVIPGVGYRVQFKNSLGDAVWQDLSAPISIIGGSAVLHDASPASGQRFYRIIAKP
jgi:Tol biopolymer transport system component